MYRRSFLVAALSAATALSAPPAPAKPKLVLLVAVDQFRYDYLLRFRADYSGGLKRLLEQGAVFTNAYFDHFPTVTAVGHSIMLTGAMPSVSGIIGNEWYDRGSRLPVTSVSDGTVKLVGGQPDRPGNSPRRLMVSTLGDELKSAGKARKVAGISMKDRSAILSAGHMADAAFWFDATTGRFVSSTYYMPDLPAWAAKFNEDRFADRWLGKEWTPAWGGAAFAKMPDQPGQAYYDAIYETSFGNELLLEFVLRAIEAEKLGQTGEMDLLALSFSSNDAVGHDHGPDSAQVRDVSIVTDRALARLFEALDKRIGMSNVLVVLTADHGVAPAPEVSLKRKIPAGRYQDAALAAAVDKALVAQYGEAKWVVGRASGGAIYLDHALVKERKLNLLEVQRRAAEALRELPYVGRAYAREDMAQPGTATDLVARRVLNGFNYARSGDVIVVQKPYWLAGKEGSGHSTPYGYDAHVPVIFMGAGVRAGQYHGAALVNDIAPTLAAMLEVEPPSGSMGRVLTEMLEPR
jgi:predicted AlkP superfamily pyrophosphatase or phosphodiesterase